MKTLHACSRPAQLQRPPLVIGLLALALLPTFGGCASRGPREAIRIPPVAGLRSAAEILVDRVEVDDEAPDWLDRDRVEDGMLYGIGIEAGGRQPAEDLYLAMHGARRAIVVWLEARGAGIAQPGALLPPVRIDPEHVAFERLAYDEKAHRWYALARLDIGAETAAVDAAVVELEHRLAAAQVRVVDPGVPEDDRLRAALSILYDLDRRHQYAAIRHALTGDQRTPPTGLDDESLRPRAAEVLSRHGVRVIVEGWSVPGLYEAVGGAMGEVHLPTDEFGRGLVSILVTESDGFGPGNPYLEIDGHVEVAIEGGDGRTYSTPFRVVSTGASLDEARFRAARAVNQEVGGIVRETLRTIGGARR